MKGFGEHHKSKLNSKKSKLDSQEKIVNQAIQLHMKGNIHEAMKYYQKSSNANPKYSTPVFNLATMFEQMGKLNEAKKFYIKSIKLDKNSFI